MRGLVTALRTLTNLPVPGRESPAPAAALPYFALVGGFLGAALYGVAWLIERVAWWPAGEALVIVAGAALLTRALHLDGLADWADAFGGGRSPEHTLRIMKDPHPGVFGMVAVVMVLLAKWAALERLASLNLLPWLISVMAISRCGMVWLIVRQPYARAEGGTAAPFCRDGRTWRLWACLAVAAAIAVVAGGPFGIAALLLGVLLTMAFGWWCRRRVGGVTGDLLGACNELLETALLLAVAACGPHLRTWQAQLWRLAKGSLES